MAPEELRGHFIQVRLILYASPKVSPAMWTFTSRGMALAIRRLLTARPRLQYKRLKKILKRRMATAGSAEDKAAATKESVEAEKEFLRLLRDQLKDVDR